MRDIKTTQVGNLWQLVNATRGNVLIQALEGELQYTITSTSTPPSISEPGTTIAVLSYHMLFGFVWVKATSSGRALTAFFESPGERTLFEGVYTALQQSFILNENGGAGNVSSVNTQTGDVVLDFEDVGAEQAGTANGLMTSHIEASDPHGDRAYFDGYINDFLIPGFSSALAAKANTDSPVFSGNPTTPTAPSGDNSTTIANTAFVQLTLANVLTGVWKDQGNFNAAGGAWPTSANTIESDTPKAGYLWKISTGGTLTGGIVVNTGDIIRALVDNPGNTATDWAANESNLGYVPENQVNKATSLAEPDDIKFPTVQAIVTALADYTLIANQRYSINAQTGTSYPVSASDITPNGRVIIECTNSAAISVSVGTPSSYGRSVGDSFNIRQGGAGAITLTGTGLSGNPTTGAQYETKTLVASSGTTWMIVGG